MRRPSSPSAAMVHPNQQLALSFITFRLGSDLTCPCVTLHTMEQAVRPGIETTALITILSLAFILAAHLGVLADPHHVVELDMAADRPGGRVSPENGAGRRVVLLCTSATRLTHLPLYHYSA